MIIKNVKKIKGLRTIKLKAHYDERGFFSRLFCKETFAKKKLFKDVKQINISYNKKTQTFRGFHFQLKPHQEKKFIFCISGKIQIGLIDLRKKSKTYLNCFTKIISSDDNLAIYVPDMVATSFLTLKDNTKIIYLMSEYYKPKYSAGINFKDKKIKIKWKKKFRIISSKDKRLPFFNI